MAAPALPRLLMADDHHVILDALGIMMKNEFNVLAVDSSQAAMNAVDEFHPDVAMLDINLPGGDGFATARKMLERRPGLPIVFLSMYGDPNYVHQAAQLGAKAYISKSAPAQELISTLHAVLQGNTLLPDKAEIEADGSSQETGKADLTARQREVLRLIALGCSAKDIANQLNISVRTAEFHRAAIMQRLGLHSTAQMTRYAIANNLG
ncbi:MAG: response regulator transcription factor [Acidobacteriaceae bacterium]|nr:response regulator transcription factor [Acidobacteriaceae bacterium]